MTRISFRAYRLGERETVTGDALRRMAGQTFVFRDDDRTVAASVIEAYVRDGWIVITSDVGADDFSARIAESFTLGPVGVHILPDMPAEQRYVPGRSEPDWQSVQNWLGSARLERLLDQGLARVAAERWWFDRMADSKGEWLVGPEFRLHWLP